MNEIMLEGCTPTPLASYLKAIGILRLLSTRYPLTRAAWRDGCIVLHTAIDRAGLVHFFLHDYQPTPVMAPWNGGSGFYEKDNKAALNAIRASTTARLNEYNKCLHIADAQLAGLDRKASPKGDAKTGLLGRLRGSLSDTALDWFDAAVLLAGDSPQYPPLLGTGGNDGRLDFTNNFMQRLIDVFDPGTGEPSEASAGWLTAAIFGATSPGFIRSAVGQFSPGQAGGPNATTGFGGTFQEANATINPWDFILMIEGALPFAAAAVRRNAEDAFGVLSYPFTVRAVGAGSGSLGDADAAAARGELWMPLWDQPATYPEIHSLLAEGRVALGKKPARDALDFIRAVHQLGGYRGIRSFQRFGLLMRSGKAYLATPLERVEVSNNPLENILDELDHNDWLSQFRRFAQGDKVGNRFLTLRRRLEAAFFELSGKRPPARDVQSVLMLLGDIQTAMARSSNAREAVPPIPRLSEHWVQQARDGTPAFRIASALAGLEGTTDKPLPLRAQLFPVHPCFNNWMEDAHKTKGAANDPYCDVRLHTGLHGNLPEALHALLKRRLWLAEKLEMRDEQGRPVKPLDSFARTGLGDLDDFLRDDAMDRRIAELLPGLCLCAIPPDVEPNDGAVPAAFALLKLCVTPDRILRNLKRKNTQERLLSRMGADDRLPISPGMIALLAAGNHKNRAVEAAWRRLRASNLAPAFDRQALPSETSIDPMRTAAALLIPLRTSAIAALTHSVMKPIREETTTEAEPT